MAEYEFRLRFNLANAYRIGSDAEELELFALPTGERFRLRTAVVGTPIKDHARAAILGGAYASGDQARAAAERAKVALLYWASRSDSVSTSATVASEASQLKRVWRCYESSSGVRFGMTSTGSMSTNETRALGS